MSTRVCQTSSAREPRCERSGRRRGCEHSQDAAARLVVAAASGGRFCGVASAPVAFDGESDEDDAPACDASRLKDDDAAKAGDVAGRGRAARACARKLSSLDPDKPQAPIKAQVDEALELGRGASRAHARNA